MNNLNSILIEGNIVADAKITTTPRGTLVASFSIASVRYNKRNDGLEKETSFFDVEAWARLAESCANLGGKGRGVRVVGRVKQERWTGSDGRPHSRVKIIAEHLEFRPQYKKGAINE